LTITAGKSAPQRYEMPSCLSETPGLEELVIARAPVEEAPYTILIAAISDSA